MSDLAHAAALGVATGVLLGRQDNRREAGLPMDGVDALASGFRFVGTAFVVLVVLFIAYALVTDALGIEDEYERCMRQPHATACDDFFAESYV